MMCHRHQPSGGIRSMLVIVVSLLLAALTATIPTTYATPIRRSIPRKVLIGYTSGHNYEFVKKAVMYDHVNVVIWAFMDIVHDATTTSTSSTDGEGERRRRILQQSLLPLLPGGHVQTGLDLHRIQHLINELDGIGYSHVVHLVSFGGWDGQHLDTKLTAQEWYSIWKNSIASSIFHGIDWDLEGNDNLTSMNNVFTVECLDKMGNISTLMKNDGYIVTMAPPLSYLNFNNSNFSRYVNQTIPDRPWHTEFHYFGSNVYAYLLARYGDYIDLVSIQLYESYSDAALEVYHNGVAAEDYLYNFVYYNVAIQQQNEALFHVNFSQDSTLNMQDQIVHLNLSKLVIGLANGWAKKDQHNQKTLYISATACKDAYFKLKNSNHGNLTPRGFMYWTIEERGTNEVYLARDIGKFLHDDDDIIITA